MTSAPAIPCQVKWAVSSARDWVAARIARDPKDRKQYGTWTVTHLLDPDADPSRLASYRIVVTVKTKEAARAVQLRPFYWGVAAGTVVDGTIVSADAKRMRLRRRTRAGVLQSAES